MLQQDQTTSLACPLLQPLTSVCSNLYSGSLARELRIGLESILFIDDNPAEVADVRAALPTVGAWCWPQNHVQAKSEMGHVWQLDLALRRALTEEDARRAASYEAEARRRADIAAAAAAAAEAPATTAAR